MLEAEEVIVDKVKRVRKCKSIMLKAKAKEAKELEPELKTKIARTSKALVLSRALAIQTPITNNKIMLEL
jgi:hypothetical protein